MNNPFVTKGYAGPEYFCDRVKETENVVRLLTNENNMALISPRRLGKTDLIRHCFSLPEISTKYYTFLIDIYATNSLSDFVEIFGRAILEELKPLGRKAWEQFFSAIKSIQQQISFDINGNPVWGIGLGMASNPATTLDEIFKYLGNADKPCLVAIDEFQRITEYPNGQNVEALLRTYIQRCNNATFLFSGSKRHLMSEIFTSPARPFYQSVVTMGLGPIPEDRYADFAMKLFAKNNKTLPLEVVQQVYRRFHGTTAYLQRLMNVLFFNTEQGKACSPDMIDDAIHYLIGLNSEHYETLFSQLSEKQRLLFVAIASEKSVKSISSAEFTHKYHLSSPSSAVSAMRGLLDKDFVTQDKGEYYIYDQLFQMWVEDYYV